MISALMQPIVNQNDLFVDNNNQPLVPLLAVKYRIRLYIDDGKGIYRAKFRHESRNQQHALLRATPECSIRFSKHKGCKRSRRTITYNIS